MTTELATAQTSIQQLSDERDSLQRRLAKRQVGASGSGTGGNSGSSELEYYRKIVKCVRALFIHPCPTMLPVATLWDRCTLCRVNDKDAILSKCMHAFCRGCVPHSALAPAPPSCLHTAAQRRAHNVTVAKKSLLLPHVRLVLCSAGASTRGSQSAIASALRARYSLIFRA